MILEGKHIAHGDVLFITLLKEMLSVKVGNVAQEDPHLESPKGMRIPEKKRPMFKCSSL